LNVIPLKDSVSLLPLAVDEEVAILSIPNPGVLNTRIIHNQPAYIGEHYDFKIELQSVIEYKITDVTMRFVEVSKIDGPLNKRAIMIRSNSKQDKERSFWVYSRCIVEGKEIIEELLKESYTISLIEKEHEVIPLYLKFHEEGERTFEIHLRYSARKVMSDGSLGIEFTMNSKQKFTINVITPFEISWNWLIFGYKPLPKDCLMMNKKTLIDANIIAKGAILIHNAVFNIKEKDLIHSLNTRHNLNQYPVEVLRGETFNQLFTLLPIAKFNNKDVGDIEITWSRIDNKEQCKCHVNMNEVNCVNPLLDIHLSSPTEGYIFKEFNMEVILENISTNILELKITINDIPSLLIEGEIRTNVTLFPYRKEILNYTLLPVMCGNLELPSISVESSYINKSFLARPNKTVFIFPGS